jgi:hypothetical protein
VLTIRDEQMRVLREALREPFYRRVLDELRADSPTALSAAGQERARAFVTRAAALAYSHGITQELDVAYLAGLFFRAGVLLEGPDDFALLAPALAPRTLTAAQKLERVHDLLLESS